MAEHPHGTDEGVRCPDFQGCRQQKLSSLLISVSSRGFVYTISTKEGLYKLVAQTPLKLKTSANSSLQETLLEVNLTLLLLVELY